MVERGYEGYVAKDEASVYEGGPTRRWPKVKQEYWTVEGDGWRRRFAIADRGSRTPGRCGRLLSLLTELDAFFTDHHYCGDLDAGVDGPIVWVACPCGAAWRGEWTRTTE